MQSAGINRGALYTHYSSLGELAFALLDVAAAEKLLGGPIPDAWRRFAR